MAAAAIVCLTLSAVALVISFRPAQPDPVACRSALAAAYTRHLTAPALGQVRYPQACNGLSAATLECIAYDVLEG